VMIVYCANEELATTSAPKTIREAFMIKAYYALDPAQSRSTRHNHCV
jgi:hypothetical protein